jgi:hypothetical protein
MQRHAAFEPNAHFANARRWRVADVRVTRRPVDDSAIFSFYGYSYYYAYAIGRGSALHKDKV